MTIQALPATEHLVPLGRTRWTLWRDAALRGAGFPAGLFGVLCDTELADAADRWDDSDTDRQAYERDFAAATTRLSAAVSRIAGDARFREAITWQNPDLVGTCLDKAAAGEPRNVRGRNHELAIASYLQRYCLKNDTIGFFGPVGWARIDPDDTGMTLSAGAVPLTRRSTNFERWAIDAVAERLAARPEVWPWLRPRVAPSASLAGFTVRVPFEQPTALSAQELRVLRQCDGGHTVAEIAGYPPDPQVTNVLVRLRSRGVIRMELLEQRAAAPEHELVHRINAIDDQDVRDRTRRPLDELVAARDAVSAAAGDPDRLLTASTALAETFRGITGSAATRFAGATYVGRTLVYEDAVRAIDVHIGRQVSDLVAEPLGLLLDSANWLANAVAGQYLARAVQVVDRDLARTGADGLPLLSLFTTVLWEMASPGAGAFESGLVDEVAGEFQRRWATIFDPPAGARRHQVAASAIADEVAAAFPATRPLFSGARWHSPDVMIAADSVAAINRGDVRFVLGELHCATNTLETLVFAAQHPDPQRLRAAAAASGPAGRVFTIARTDSHQASTRMSRAPEFLLPQYTYLCMGAESQTPPPGATVHAVLDMTVHRRGDDLVVRHRSGREYDFLEVLGEPLSALCAAAFRLAGGAGHSPRISIDRLTVTRESWSFPAGEVRWAFCADERDRYAQARRWRREHAVPERGFVRIPVERKPMAVDFRSLPMVNLLAKSIRRTAAAGPGRFTVSEMLPDLDQLWLRDAAGGPYTAELRLVAVDPQP